LFLLCNFSVTVDTGKVCSSCERGVLPVHRSNTKMYPCLEVCATASPVSPSVPSPLPSWRLGEVSVPYIVMHALKVPDHLSLLYVERDQAVGVRSSQAFAGLRSPKRSILLERTPCRASLSTASLQLLAAPDFRIAIGPRLVARFAGVVEWCGSSTVAYPCARFKPRTLRRCRFGFRARTE